MPAVVPYDPKLVVVTFGSVLVTGFAEESMIDVEVPDDYGKTVGADGAVTRSRNADRSVSVTLTLMQSSPANALIAALANLDRVGPGSPQAFAIKDFLGTTLVAAAEAWVRKRPNIVFGKNVNEREWIIDTGEALISM